MKLNRFAENTIAFARKQEELGTKAMEVFRRRDFNDAIFRKEHSKAGLWSPVITAGEADLLHQVRPPSCS